MCQFFRLVLILAVLHLSYLYTYMHCSYHIVQEWGRGEPPGSGAEWQASAFPPYIHIHCLLPSLAYSTNPLFNCSTLHLHNGPPTSNITTSMVPKTQSAPKEFQHHTISHINTMHAFNSNAHLPISAPALSAHQEIDAVGGCKCTHRW